MAKVSKVEEARQAAAAKQKEPPKVRATATVASKPGVGATNEPKVGLKAPMFRIEKHVRKERFLNLLIYGGYGVGKTTLAASATEVPSMNDVLLLGAESGEMSLEEQPGLYKVPISTFRQFGQIHSWLKEHCKARDAGDKKKLIELQAVAMDIDEKDIKEPLEIYTCIIDSLTEIEAYCFNQLLGITANTRIDQETDTAEFKEYKLNNGMILRLVRNFRDLPMHVIFIAAEQYIQDDLKRMKFSPDMTGKLAKKIQGFMDMVGYYSAAPGEAGGAIMRTLNVTPNRKWDAKHRYAGFKKQGFTDPTVAKILKEVGLLDRDGAALK